MARRFPFHPYPNSWFVVAFSHELPVKGVMPLKYFGKDLVLFRTEDGTARVFDAFCPHLGAHLAYGGTVVDGTLRCLFHGWRFDGVTGHCTHVPFANKIPPRAAVKAWPVAEQDGVIYVYHHAEGDAPTWEVPKIHTPEWSEPTFIKWQLKTCCQEILENSVDSSHVPTVHDARRPAKYTPKTTKGPILEHSLNIQWDGAYIGFPGTEMDVRLDVSVCGLGVIHVDTFAEMVGMQARQRILVTPIDEDHIHLRAALHVRRMHDEETTQNVHKMFQNGFETDFVKDFPIWENKIYQAQPLLSEADGPIGVFRKWARQFYSAEAPPAADADKGQAASTDGPVVPFGKTQPTA